MAGSGRGVYSQRRVGLKPDRSIRHFGQQLALRLGVFDVARAAYQVVFNRAYRTYLRERQRLFEIFVRPNSLVFDLGANKGEFSLLFSRIGADVVAVEPNPFLAEGLRSRFGASRVVEAAVGAEPGRATLYLGLDSNYSTISERWKPVVEERQRLTDTAVDVDVTTLDALIDRFGMPSFAKIDVEGHELEVFRGLSSPIDALLFEFQCPLFDEFEATVGRLEQLARYEYGIESDGVVGWMTPENITGCVGDMCRSGAGSGDVFARRRGSG
jgi:FkbM family methyltransferase